MVLVLCGLDDLDALWFARRVVQAGLECTVVTTEALSYARSISHPLGAAGVDTTVVLADGTEVDGRAGVVNRMVEPPAQAWARSDPAEREYAALELQALVLSWLHGVPGPVRNRPEPDCLAGPLRHPFVTVTAARRSGLLCPEVWSDTADPLPPAEALWTAAAAAAGPAGRAVQVVCLDGVVLAPAVPEPVAAGVAALAAGTGAGEALIGVNFLVGPGGWWFAGSTPLPRLRAGGRALSDHLITVLAPGTAEVRR